MKAILEFDDFMNDLSLTAQEQDQIKSFMDKYSKFANFHNDDTFEDSVDMLTDEIMKKYGFQESKRNDVQQYLSSLQDLSDGLSVIMSPGPETIYRGRRRRLLSRFKRY